MPVRPTLAGKLTVVRNAPGACGGGPEPFLARSDTIAAFVSVAFDPDGGENQDGCRSLARGHVHVRPGATRRCIGRKFNDGAHIDLLLAALHVSKDRRHTVIKSEHG
jgi:hypothetical protein